MLRIHRQTEAAADLRRHPADFERLRQSREDRRCERFGALGGGRIPREQQELVAAHARDRGAAPDAALSRRAASMRTASPTAWP